MNKKQYIPQSEHGRLKRTQRWLAIVLTLVLIVSTFAGSIAPAVAEETDDIYLEDVQTDYIPEEDLVDIPEPSSEKTNEQDEPVLMSDFALNNSISGLVWLDTNADGYLDADEYGVAGYEVGMYIDGSLAASTVTDADGMYYFYSLIPAEYTVGIGGSSLNDTEYLVPDMSIQGGEDNFFNADYNSNPILAHTDIITMSADTQLAGINAALRITGQDGEHNDKNEELMLTENEQNELVEEGADAGPQEQGTASISGAVWFDADEDGVWGEDEQGLEGFALDLYAAGELETVLASVSTGENGAYSFTGLAANDYIVAISMQTIAEQEYLLPLGGISGDNAFEIDWTRDPIIALSGTISLAEEANATEVSAGVRVAGGIAPMSISGGYRVTLDSNGSLIGTYNTLADAMTACNNKAACTITVNGNDEDMGSAAALTNATVTLKSGAGGPYYIKQPNADMHISVSAANLKLENITLKGAGFGVGPNNNGGIYSTANSSLEMNNASTICEAAVAISAENSNVTLNSGCSIMNNVIHVAGYDAVPEHVIYLKDNSTLVMNGGDIIGNATTGSAMNLHGGAIFVAKTASFTMHGGRINYNTTVSCGAAALVNGLFTMNGGEMRGNVADLSAGAICVNAGTEGNGRLVMNDGVISGNTSDDHGGAVRVNNRGSGSNSGSFEMNGGIISDNTSRYGGAVYLDSWSSGSNRNVFKMNGGTFSGNTASSYGGAICMGTYYGADSAVVIKSGCEFINNTAECGGAIFTPPQSYKNPEEINLYHSVSIESGVLFSGNTATSGESYAPDNAADFNDSSKRGSLPTFDGNLLNNNDINYVKPYKMTYVANNGTGEANVEQNSREDFYSTSLYGNNNTNFSLPAGALAFKCWNTMPDGSGKSYAPYSSVTLKDDIVLYAQWKTTATLVISKVSNIILPVAILPDGQEMPGVEFRLYSADTTKTPEKMWTEGSEYWVNPISFTTDAKGYGKVEGLAPGKYILVETKTLEDYILPKGQWLVEINAGLEFSFTSIGNAPMINGISMDETGNVVWEIPNFADIHLGGITIGKTYNGSYANPDQEFKFTVNVSNIGEGASFDYTGGVIDGSGATAPEGGTIVFDASGKANFYLKHGQTITINGIAPEFDWEITEATQSYYTTEYIDPYGYQYTGNSCYVYNNKILEFPTISFINECTNTYYSVIYKANNGTDEPDVVQSLEEPNSNALYGNDVTSFTAPDTAVFEGWNTEPDGSGTSYAPGDLVPRDENLVLYAQWKSGAKFSFYKANGTVDTWALEGMANVEFKLYKADTTKTPEDMWTQGSEYWVYLDTQNSNQLGLVDFGELKEGEYILVETATNPGFALPSGQWHIAVDSDYNLSLTARGRTPEFFERVVTESNGIEINEMSWVIYNYLARELEINNTVIESPVNTSKEFEYTIYIKQELDGNFLPEGTVINYTGGILPGSGASAPANGSLTIGADGTAKINLKHGQTITLACDSSMDVRVVQKAETDYDTSYTIESVGSSVDGLDTGYISLWRDSDKASFVNEIEAYCTVTYKSNNGKNEPDEVQSLKEPNSNQLYDLNDTEFTMPDDGGMFLGWNTEPDGSGKSYDPGETVPRDENLVLYAQWKMETTLIFRKVAHLPDETILQSEPLAGVEFMLYRADTTKPIEPMWTEGSVFWVDPIHLVSDANGMVRVDGLRIGTYMLVETKTASGYLLPTGQWKITIDDYNLSDNWEAVGDVVSPWWTMLDGYDGMLTTIGNHSESLLRSLTIDKTYTGAGADPDREFSFAIRGKSQQNGYLSAPIYEGKTLEYTGGVIEGSGATAPADGTLVFDASGTAYFKLKHGQSITISGILMNYEFTVIEELGSDYTTKLSSDGGALLEDNSCELSFSESSLERKLSFFNETSDRRFILTYVANNGVDTFDYKQAPDSSGNLNILGIDDTGFQIPPYYEFEGWNTEPDGSGKWYFPGKSLTLSSDMILYGQWDDGRVHMIIEKEVTGTYGDKDRYFDITLYFTGSEGQTPEAGTVYEYTGGIVPGSGVTAPENGRIILDANGMATIRIKHGQLIDIECFGVMYVYAEETPVDGYDTSVMKNHYTEWISAGNSEYVDFDDHAEENTITFINDCTNTGFTITYKPNNGTDEPDVVLPLSDPANETVCGNDDTNFTPPNGGEFIGWNTEPDGSGTSYAPGDHVTNEENLVLYAQWKSGAKFSFYKASGHDDLPIHEIEGMTNVEFRLYKADTTKTPEDMWTQGSEYWVYLDTQRSNQLGLVDFGELKEGEYILVETATNPGYAIRAGQWHISVDSDFNLSLTTRGFTPSTYETVIEKSNGTEINEKSWVIYNYLARELEINNTVIESPVDTSKEFEYTIYIETGSGPLPEGTVINYTGGILPGSGASAPADGSLTIGADGTAKINLKHGQTITLACDSNMEVRVVQKAETEYDTSYTIESVGTSVDGLDTGYVSLWDNDDKLSFVNSDDSPIPTGVRESQQGVAFIAGFAMLSVAGSVLSRAMRRRRNGA